MTPASLTEAIHATWADRDKLIEALRNAPPADGTNRVLEMIEEIQK
jgi:UDP-N-acetylglucosamine--N-acetylmuramyl-(pentapeptide) pyrophosphoryl-undecaprenol N-acetylglucosamine transferase